MILATLGDCLALPDPVDGDKAGVEDGQRKDCNGDDETPPGRTGCLEFHADDCEQETHEECAGVTHEDGRRIEVVAKEPKAGARQGDGKAANEDLPVHRGDGEEAHGGDCGCAGGEAIHVVEKVDGIGDPDHPQAGQGQV